MDSQASTATLLLVIAYAYWLYRAVVLYNKIDAQYHGFLPALHSRLQLLTDRSSTFAFIRLLISNRSKNLGVPAIQRELMALRLLAVPWIFLWGYVMYLWA